MYYLSFVNIRLLLTPLYLFLIIVWWLCKAKRSIFQLYIVVKSNITKKNILGRQSASHLDGLSNCFLCCVSIQFHHGRFPLTPVYYFRHTWLSYIFRKLIKRNKYHDIVLLLYLYWFTGRFYNTWLVYVPSSICD